MVCHVVVKSNCAKDIRSPSYLYHQIHVEDSVFSCRVSFLADPGTAVLRRVLITGGYFTAQPGPPRANNRRRPSTTISFINDRQLHQRPSNDQQRPATTSNDQQRPATTSNDYYGPTKPNASRQLTMTTSHGPCHQ